MIQKATGKQWRCVRGYSFSVGTAGVHTFLWLQQLPGYNVTVILPLTPQQTLCTLEQFGSVDLASEWQLKYLCLQTARLTEFLQKPFHQNSPAICVSTNSHPVSESDAASVVVDE